ncbi:amidohydrolase [bacterium 210820-DFI.6.37]|nr:amidohydrolase [bacterium 210820-DFI.6.37]
MKVDKLFVNGRVYTMEAEGETRGAIAVTGDRIVKTFATDDLEGYEADEVIDLHGKSVLPGFIDCHLHLLSYTQSLQSVSLRGCKSWEECKEKLIERARITPKGEWVRGAAFNHEDWTVPELPDRYELDTISTEHPIIIGRYCMHVSVTNSLALELAGIDRDFIPEAENSVAKDESGEPTGVLWESAITPVLNIIPDKLATTEAKKDAIEEVIADMNSYGITGAHPIQGKFCDAVEFMDVYQEMEEEGRLNLRLYISYDDFPSFSMKTGFGNEKIKYGFYKIYSDGSLGSRAAALYEPYSDAPGVCGVCNYSQEEINQMCQEAYNRNLQIGIHAIGDKGLDIALTAIEKCYYADPKPDYRFRLIHVMCTNEDLIARMKKLPVVLDIQPKFVSTNVSWSEERLGKERSKYAYPWRRLLDEGFVITGSSDAPVEPYNPFLGVYAVTTRKDLDGNPKDGWYPEQCVSVYEALEMYTKNAAFSSFEENLKGTIKEGKLADFIVLDTDPFKVEPEKTKDILVEQTYLGGKRVYQR